MKQYQRGMTGRRRNGEIEEAKVRRKPVLKGKKRREGEDMVGAVKGRREVKQN